METQRAFALGEACDVAEKPNGDAVLQLLIACQTSSKTKEENMKAGEKTLQEMLKERKELDEQIAAKRKADRVEVVEKVKQLCKDYEISQGELRGALKTRPKPKKAEGAEKTPAKSRGSAKAES